MVIKRVHTHITYTTQKLNNRNLKMNTDNMNIETTTDTTTFINKINERSKYLSDNKIGNPDRNEVDYDNTYRIQDLYVSVRMIQIHELLRDEIYSTEEKKEILNPYIGVVYGDVDEEFDLLLNMSRKLDLIDELIKTPSDTSEIIRSNTEFYFTILREVGNLIIDNILDESKTTCRYNEVQDEINQDYERSMNDKREIMKDVIKKNEGFLKLNDSVEFDFGLEDQDIHN